MNQYINMNHSDGLVNRNIETAPRFRPHPSDNQLQPFFVLPIHNPMMISPNPFGYNVPVTDHINIDQSSSGITSPNSESQKEKFTVERWSNIVSRYIGNTDERPSCGKLKDDVYFTHRSGDAYLLFEKKSDYINHFITYYFSDRNLQKDKKLADLMDDKGAVPLSALIKFPKLNQVDTSIDELVQALNNNTLLSLTETKASEMAVRRRNGPLTTTATTTTTIDTSITRNGHLVQDDSTSGIGSSVGSVSGANNNNSQNVLPGHLMSPMPLPHGTQNNLDGSINAPNDIASPASATPQQFVILHLNAPPVFPLHNPSNSSTNNPYFMSFNSNSTLPYSAAHHQHHQPQPFGIVPTAPVAVSQQQQQQQQAVANSIPIQNHTTTIYSSSSTLPTHMYHHPQHHHHPQHPQHPQQQQHHHQNQNNSVSPQFAHHISHAPHVSPTPPAGFNFIPYAPDQLIAAPMQNYSYCPITTAQPPLQTLPHHYNIMAVPSTINGGGGNTNAHTNTTRYNNNNNNNVSQSTNSNNNISNSSTGNTNNNNNNNSNSESSSTMITTTTSANNNNNTLTSASAAATTTN